MTVDFCNHLANRTSCVEQVLLKLHNVFIKMCLQHLCSPQINKTPVLAGENKFIHSCNFVF